MLFEEFRDIIKAGFPEVTKDQMEQFAAMDALYRGWNAKINVISRKDIDELYRHHVLHSLCIAAYIKLRMPDVYDRLRGEGPYSVSEPLKILDLGTGGGFPGIPLAVMFPHAEFTLCDSILPLSALLGFFTSTDPPKKPSSISTTISSIESVS